MAERIQRKRSKGWRMPAGAIYVGRPTMWGNPWKVRNGCDAAAVVALFEAWMTGFYSSTALPSVPDVRELRGKDLACWCRLDQPCHADVLLGLANRAAYDAAGEDVPETD